MNPLLRPLEELAEKWTNVTVGENKFGNIRLRLGYVLTSRDVGRLLKANYC